MDYYLIFLIAAIVIIGILTFKKSQSLTMLKMLPGESSLFEDEPVTFRLDRKRFGHSRSYYKGKMQVTNKRIIGWAKSLWGTTYVITIAVEYNNKYVARTRDVMGGFLLKNGYMEYGVEKSDISFGKEKDKDVMIIALHWDSKLAFFASNMKLIIESKNLAKYKKALGIK